MNVCLYAEEKKEKECNYRTHTQTSILVDIQSQAKESKSYSLTLSFPFSFSSCLVFIQSSVMPSCCVYNFLFHSLLIFIFNFTKILSTNDYHHQILKVDVGQDITMSCIFDEEKIEQVNKN
jgi:hypothetical protein